MYFKFLSMAAPVFHASTFFVGELLSSPVIEIYFNRRPLSSPLFPAVFLPSHSLTSSSSSSSSSSFSSSPPLPPSPPAPPTFFSVESGPPVSSMRVFSPRDLLRLFHRSFLAYKTEHPHVFSDVTYVLGGSRAAAQVSSFPALSESRPFQDYDCFVLLAPSSHQDSLFYSTHISRLIQQFSAFLLPGFLPDFKNLVCVPGYAMLSFMLCDLVILVEDKASFLSKPFVFSSMAVVTDITPLVCSTETRADSHSLTSRHFSLKELSFYHAKPLLLLDERMPIDLKNGLKLVDMMTRGYRVFQPVFYLALRDFMGKALNSGDYQAQLVLNKYVADHCQDKGHAHAFLSNLDSCLLDYSVARSFLSARRLSFQDTRSPFFNIFELPSISSMVFLLWQTCLEAPSGPEFKASERILETSLFQLCAYLESVQIFKGESPVLDWFYSPSFVPQKTQVLLPLIKGKDPIAAAVSLCMYVLEHSCLRKDQLETFPMTFVALLGLDQSRFYAEFLKAYTRYLNPIPLEDRLYALFLGSLSDTDLQTLVVFASQQFHFKNKGEMRFLEFVSFPLLAPRPISFWVFFFSEFESMSLTSEMIRHHVDFFTHITNLVLRTLEGTNFSAQTEKKALPFGFSSFIHLYLVRLKDSRSDLWSKPFLKPLMRLCLALNRVFESPLLSFLVQNLGASKEELLERSVFESRFNTYLLEMKQFKYLLEGSLPADPNDRFLVLTHFILDSDKDVLASYQDALLSLSFKDLNLMGSLFYLKQILSEHKSLQLSDNYLFLFHFFIQGVTHYFNQKGPLSQEADFAAYFLPMLDPVFLETLNTLMPVFFTMEAVSFEFIVSAFYFLHLIRKHRPDCDLSRHFWGYHDLFLKQMLSLIVRPDLSPKYSKQLTRLAMNETIVLLHDTSKQTICDRYHRLFDLSLLTVFDPLLSGDFFAVDHDPEGFKSLFLAFNYPDPFRLKILVAVASFLSQERPDSPLISPLFKALEDSFKTLYSKPYLDVLMKDGPFLRLHTQLLVIFLHFKTLNVGLRISDTIQRALNPGRLPLSLDSDFLTAGLHLLSFSPADSYTLHQRASVSETVLTLDDSLPAPDNLFLSFLMFFLHHLLDQVPRLNPDVFMSFAQPFLQHLKATPYLFSDQSFPTSLSKGVTCSTLDHPVFALVYDLGSLSFYTRSLGLNSDSDSDSDSFFKQCFSLLTQPKSSTQLQMIFLSRVLLEEHQSSTLESEAILSLMGLDQPSLRPPSLSVQLERLLFILEHLSALKDNDSVMSLAVSSLSALIPKLVVGNSQLSHVGDPFLSFESLGCFIFKAFNRLIPVYKKLYSSTPFLDWSTHVFLQESLLYFGTLYSDDQSRDHLLTFSSLISQRDFESQKSIFSPVLLLFKFGDTLYEMMHHIIRLLQPKLMPVISFGPLHGLRLTPFVSASILDQVMEGIPSLLDVLLKASRCLSEQYAPQNLEVCRFPVKLTEPLALSFSDPVAFPNQSISLVLVSSSILGLKSRVKTQEFSVSDLSCLIFEGTLTVLDSTKQEISSTSHVLVNARLAVDKAVFSKAHSKSKERSVRLLGVKLEFKDYVFKLESVALALSAPVSETLSFVVPHSFLSQLYQLYSLTGTLRAVKSKIAPIETDFFMRYFDSFYAKLILPGVLPDALMVFSHTCFLFHVDHFITWNPVSNGVPGFFALQFSEEFVSTDRFHECLNRFILLLSKRYTEGPPALVEQLFGLLHLSYRYYCYRQYRSGSSYQDEFHSFLIQIKDTIKPFESANFTLFFRFVCTDASKYFFRYLHRLVVAAPQFRDISLSLEDFSGRFKFLCMGED